MIGSRFEALLVRIGALQARRPWVPFVLCAIVTAFAAVLAGRLELKTKFDQLLPDTQPSVVELRRVADKTSAVSNVFVVLEGEDRATLRKMGDALVPELRAIGAPWVTSASDGVQEARAFLLARAGLFTTVEELRQLRADVDARWEAEVAKAFGADLDDEEDAPPPLTADALKKRFLGPLGADGEAQATEIDARYPDGYFEAKDGKALVVVARSSSAGGDLDLSRATLDRVKSAVAKVHASDPSFAPVKVGYAGDLVTGLFEYGAIRDDLVNVGLLGVGLVLSAVLLYFMRLRALAAMGVTVATGLAWTFGVTQLAIGHLNVATGFLVSIVAGNGINFGIIYMARYLEARRDGEDVARAIETAHRGTWLATLAAGTAAAASYGSLAVTDFRGFKHFALIGAAGMVLCWLATYLLTPAVLAMVERVRPFRAGSLGARAGFWSRLRSQGSRYGAPFAWLVARAPRLLTVAGAALALVSAGAIVRYVRSDPMEYDMRRMQNDLGGGAEVYRVSALARDVIGANTESGMVLLVDRLEQVAPLKKALEARRDAAPEGEKPFEAVHALSDFVPEDQPAKLPILAEIRERLVKARAKGFVKDDEWRQLEPLLPPEGLAAFGLAELPDDLARPFTEKDGTRGRLVFVEPTAGKNDNDLRYLLRWADSFRETKLPTGETVLGSGRAVIFADMLRAVIADIPKAIAASLGMTVLAVALTFRRGGRALWVLASLLVGVAWTGAFMAIFRVKINFLNFIALPITFGIGADYAVNVMQRYVASGDVVAALRSTGGAVVLCSLTTILGYLALLGSLNQAVRSLGLVAVVGEIACLVAAVVVLPAALLWRDRRRARHASAAEHAEAA